MVCRETHAGMGPKLISVQDVVAQIFHVFHGDFKITITALCPSRKTFFYR